MCTVTFIGALGPSHPFALWLTYHVYVPGGDVDGIGGGIGDPPVATVYHCKPVPIAVSGATGPSFWQNTRSLVTGASGNGPTLTVVEIAHVVGSVYVIHELPIDTPLTTPELKPTVATVLLLLLHVPPADELLNVVTEPIQIFTGPVIAAGNGLIFTGAVT